MQPTLCQRSSISAHLCVNVTALRHGPTLVCWLSCPGQGQCSHRRAAAETPQPRRRTPVEGTAGTSGLAAGLRDAAASKHLFTTGSASAAAVTPTTYLFSTGGASAAAATASTCASSTANTRRQCQQGHPAAANAAGAHPPSSSRAAKAASNIAAAGWCNTSSRDALSATQLQWRGATGSSKGEHLIPSSISSSAHLPECGGFHCANKLRE